MTAILSVSQITFSMNRLENQPLPLAALEGNGPLIQIVYVGDQSTSILSSIFFLGGGLDTPVINVQDDHEHRNDITHVSILSIAVTDAPYQFSMMGKYTATEVIDWATCEAIYRDQFAAGQTTAADGSLTTLAQNNFGDLFNADITVSAVTTGLILAEGTGMDVSVHHYCTTLVSLAIKACLVRECCSLS